MKQLAGFIHGHENPNIVADMSFHQVHSKNEPSYLDKGMIQVLYLT